MTNTPVPDDEKRSYAGTFAFCAGALLAVGLWAVVDEFFLRRPWKQYQAEFSREEIAKARAEIAAGETALAEDSTYRTLVTELAAARAALANGEKEGRLRELERQRTAARIRLGELDQELRFVKSELEEARYEYDHALQTGGATTGAQARIDRLDAHRVEIQETFDVATTEVTRITNEIEAVHSDVKRLEDALSERRADVETIYQRLDGITVLNVRLDLPLAGQFALQVPPVPSIRQVVLEEFDRSNFDTPLARVDRCESCHVAINRRGYEDAENPLRTHPDREVLLGRHPPEKFGCTPCHAGQGAAVNSPDMAHGEVKHWEDPLRRGDKVQASCISCHLDVKSLPRAATIARGEQLFEQLGCHGCHLTAGYDGLPKVGPSLRRVAAKLDASWLVAWIENPHVVRPRTRMPNFAFERDQAISVAAYLLDAARAESDSWAAEHPLPPGVGGDPAAAGRGKELVQSLGCQGCHAFAAGEVVGVLGENKDIAPNLEGIAGKVGPRWVYHWVRNPRGYSPTTRMPNLRLSDEEASAVTAYLMTLGKPPARDPGLETELRAPERIAAGQGLVRKYGCFGCHDIPGMENESRIGVELSAFGSKVLEELFFGDETEIPRTWDAWTYHKLKTPRVYATKWIEQLMPNFELADPDIDALSVFLASRSAERVPPSYHFADGDRSRDVVAGRRLVAFYNCTGCHILEGKGGDIRRHFAGREALAPPDLLGEGEKVQSAWLYRFLKAPTPIRPWLQVRMPTFGFGDLEANTLVAYLNALDRVEVPYAYLDRAALSPAYVDAGRTLMSKDFFDCFSCHQQGERKPEGPPEGWAPDLALAHERLDPDWIVKWISDPQKLMPGTKMPSFYPDGPPDVLGGEDERQIEAIRDYIWTLGSSS
jgi:mono/diheme cytochrome c family protein